VSGIGHDSSVLFEGNVQPFKEAANVWTRRARGLSSSTALSHQFHQQESPIGLGQLGRLRGVSATVSHEPWDSGDLPLLERLMGDPR
jgi:hypothetical protein